MAIIPNNQAFLPLPSGQLMNLQTAFKDSMDTVLTGLGRDITIHLPPSKSPCSDVTCKYNSTYQRYTGTNGRICETCKGQGFLVENNQTIYIANIRWSNEPFNETVSNSQEVFPPGRLGVNFVRTKTVASSMSHVRTSIGATIDGINVELFQPPRQTGFGRLPVLYAISWWKVVNR
jgi:Zn finger protein HypA/HybF involved in hydrogenase expression